ncbi:hypothetical protein AZF37_00570 [endosymbiont 'TC1' of Trimyema compressum]|uniref:TetR/AcrR family transcriptional regulator n=1 Tax=endosymbiont 'TC1' of Trimyema compressum TaxID=243899 RepID=UPI0007F0A0EB|nr:TetR/AcrR family transcriptional regulator [endosymbiont 'TC1' of Trimyema compressum]AMP19867.1 hypothetical protein AZF37_00570 [endosymbiont 'TC1' of Trimyema compressum]
MQKITKDPDIRKQEIIDTALQLFYEKGYEQTSMLDITKKMNVSQGLCYRYFKSKEEIYSAALDNYVNDGVEMFIALYCDRTKPIAGRLSSLVSIAEINNGNQENDFFNKPGNSHFHTQMQIALCDKLYPIILNELVDAMSKNEIAIDNPEAVAAFCIYGQLGVWSIADIPDDKKISETQKLIMKMIE